MGENKNKETIWVRLKRVLKRVKVPTYGGDGGIHSDKGIQITKPQTDSTFVINDSAVVARPKK